MKTLLWISALLLGATLGLLGQEWLNSIMDFVATIYTRLFQLLAVPTIVLAIVSTFATFGSKDSGNIFGHTLLYTMTTTLAAAIVGALLYVAVSPGNLPVELIAQESVKVKEMAHLSYLEHILTVIPDNIVKPFAEGNVLSLLLLSFAVGISLSRLPDSDNKASLIKVVLGLQELTFLLIRYLIWTLPLGIVAFSAELSAQLSAGVVADSIGKYVIVVLGGNIIQMFVVLPLFLVARGINPLRVLRAMMPAVLMALFTKSSAATLPFTMESAERRLGIPGEIARFVLPICTTINMNGCAAFILVTSLFVMQNGGAAIDLPTILLWIIVSVFSAIGNAGVPMGCYFLTLSLMSGLGAPVLVLGIILPIYTIIDMIETAENVWSDSCVCAMTANDLK